MELKCQKCDAENCMPYPKKAWMCSLLDVSMLNCASSDDYWCFVCGGQNDIKHSMTWAILCYFLSKILGFETNCGVSLLQRNSFVFLITAFLCFPLVLVCQLLLNPFVFAFSMIGICECNAIGMLCSLIVILPIGFVYAAVMVIPSTVIYLYLVVIWSFFRRGLTKTS